MKFKKTKICFVLVLFICLLLDGVLTQQLSSYFFSSNFKMIPELTLLWIIFSLFFYFYGESKYIIVLIFSCFLNFYAGNLIIEYPKKKKILLITNLVINFGLLFYFKYFKF